MQKLFGGNEIYDIKDFVKALNEKILKYNNMKKWDVCLMNPPFSGVNTGDGLYIDFINKCVDISNCVVSLSPVMGYITHIVNNPVKKIIDLHHNIDKYKPNIEIIDNTFNGVVLKNNDLCIATFDKNNVNRTIQIKTKENKILEFNEQQEININDNEYLTLFFNKLSKYMFGKMYHGFINLKYPLIYINDKHNTLTFIKDNVFNHMNATNTKKDEGLKKANAIKEKQIDKNKIYLFFYKLNTSFTQECLYKFSNNKAVPYKPEYFEKIALYIKFDNNIVGLKKSEYLCSYLHTDFVKLIFKCAGEKYHQYLKYDFIPWLDFSKNYTSIELFNMIGMEYDENEINKILEQ